MYQSDRWPSPCIQERSCIDDQLDRRQARSYDQSRQLEGRHDFWQAIRDDAALGRTIVFATHYLEEADAYADRIVLISRGRIVADGTAAEVKALASGRTMRATLAGADEDGIAADLGAGSRRPGVGAARARRTVFHWAVSGSTDPVPSEHGDPAADGDGMESSARAPCS